MTESKGWNKTFYAQAVVLNVRRNFIKRFTENRILIPYLTEQCQAEVSEAKVEVIQRELTQLLDCGMSKLPEYRNVVETVKLSGSGEAARFSGVFFTEIERVLRKYVNLNKQLPIWN